MSLDRDSLSAMKVSELRELCKENGLFVSGNKTDLIDRLLGEESVSPIAEPSKKLPISDEGRATRSIVCWLASKPAAVECLIPSRK